MGAEPGGEGVVQQPVVKFPQLIPPKGRAAFQHPKQGGVGRRAPAQHDPGKPRNLRCQGMKLLLIEDVSVIADRKRTAFKGADEGFPVRPALIHSRPVPGVDDQLRERVAFVDLQNGGEFTGAVHAHSGLDRDLYRSRFKNAAEKRVQRSEIRQHTGPLVLGHYGAGGTAGV